MSLSVSFSKEGVGGGGGMSWDPSLNIPYLTLVPTKIGFIRKNNENVENFPP